MAAPIPRDPPVTIAILPDRKLITVPPRSELSVPPQAVAFDSIDNGLFRFDWKLGASTPHRIRQLERPASRASRVLPSSGIGFPGPVPRVIHTRSRVHYLSS